VDPDPDWIRIHWGHFLSAGEGAVFFCELKVSPVARMSLMEA
jgi:hypothetical protein